jgi:hypothetical protein
MSSILEKVTKNIEEKKINPRPRYYFLFKNYGLLVLFTLSILCGATIASTILFMFVDYDYNAFQDFIISLPYFWIVFLSIFIISAYYNFRNTSTGYRHEIYKIILISLLLSLAIGIVFFLMGLDSEVDELFSQKVPFYENFIYNKDDVYNSPEKGLLSGRVVDLIGMDKFILKDFNGKIWQIGGSDLEDCNFLKIQNNLELRLIGEQTGENTFDAKIIRLWNQSECK